jgi:hypothetical protein
VNVVMLVKVTETGTYRVTELPYRAKFERLMTRVSPETQDAMEAEIHRRLDHLKDHPTYWGSITNTSIEGSQPSPVTGKRGDWTGTPFDPIFWEICGQSEEAAAKLFGLLWMKVLIDRAETWIGVRNTPEHRPTFPERGLTLPGMTYFLGGMND